MRKLWLLRALLFCTVIVFMTACCQENADCPPDSFCVKAPGDCEGEGVCIEKSSVPCDVVKGPVCGCDGKTYGNVCEAAEAGVSVTNEGECKEVCKGNGNCEEGYYCAKSVGNCEGEGVCTEMPRECPEIFDPVCGCDGKTYGNACEAGAAGVTIADEGVCGEGCKGNDNCEEGYYCIKRVEDCEGEGVCTEMPMGCPDLYDPVCGCDGKTYGNACEAGAAGVTIADEGVCGEGCKGNDDCEEGYYCIKRVEDCEGEGVCTEILTVCPDLYDPVCGCDGKTYDNACEAGAAGVTIAGEGACGEGCKGNNNCEEGYYCIKRVGDCEGDGVCTEMPMGCPEIYDPVCGCDGKTYGNACEAGAAGVTIADEGECDQSCSTNDACSDDEYCAKRVSDCEGRGVCTEMPMGCPEIYDPVCGCDGKTYGNACEAGAAGVTIADEGPCKEVCKGNENCEEGYYCIKRVGDCEGSGVCTEMLTICPEIYDPVCGCDGKTYGNACEAGAAGVTIADEGACTEICKGNDNCEEGYYCIKRVGDCEGSGVCTKVLTVCPDLYDPVCGCDGKTYGNACEAGAAGVTIADQGACDQSCLTNDECSDDKYCAQRAGDCNGRGVCTETPDACTMIYDPVCGCDGKTYANDCEAGAAGVSVAEEGECEDCCPAIEKERVLSLLESLESSDKELEKAIKELKKSLGNRHEEGDKKIVWLDTIHLACKHGDKAFNYEKKTVDHLGKVKDVSIETSVMEAIDSIVSADRLIALTAINEAPDGHDKDKAITEFNKAEAENDPKKKVDHYKKAWKHINKHCNKKGKESCIDEITVLSPQNDSVSAAGNQVGHPDTTFTDIYDNTVSIHTSCSRCIYEGQEIEGWTILEIIDDGTLAEKCD